MINWVNLNNKDSFVSFSKFRDSDIVFTSIYDEAPTPFQKKILSSFGFKYIGKYFVRPKPSFEFSELSSAYPAIEQTQIQELSEICVSFNDQLPSEFKNIQQDTENNTNVDNESFSHGKFTKINDYQVKYIGGSKVAESSAAIPINLAEPTKRALDRIVEIYGDIDRWVASELNYATPEEMSQYLSPEQIDAVALNIYNAQRGEGTICLDQTGFGKGRIGAAMAAWAAHQGRNVIFLTVKADLFTDFWRDVMDIGKDHLFPAPYIMNANGRIRDHSTMKPLFSAPKPAENKAIIASGKLPDDCNIMFATYSQFNQLGSAKAEFLKQVSESTHIHADECHTAAGTSSNTHQSITHALDVASSYSFASATFAKNALDLKLYSPMWPQSWRNNENIGEMLDRAGPIALESFAKDLAERGNTIRRDHDMSNIEIQLMVDEKNKDKHEEYSDLMAKILFQMRLVSKDINDYIAKKSALSKGGKVYTMDFKSRKSALKSQFLNALKVEASVEKNIEFLMNNMKPLIVMESTMESLLRKVLDESHEALSGNIEDQEQLNIDTNVEFKDIIRLVLDDMKNIRLKKGKNPATILPIEDENILQHLEDIKSLLDSFPSLPASPLDAVKQGIEAKGLELYNQGKIDHPWKIGEVSGRSLSVGENGIQKYVAEDRNLVNHKFQNGQYDGVLLTESGSTGTSWHQKYETNEHGERYIPDPRDRVMFEHEILRKVGSRVQMHGRPYRRGTVGNVYYYTLTTALPMEHRELARQNMKMATLSAAVTGSSDAIAEMDVVNPLTSTGNLVAKQFLEDNPDIAKKMAIFMGIDEAEEGNELYFVNRLLSDLDLLLTSEREVVYENFIKLYNEEIKELASRGRHPSKPFELDGDWRVSKRDILEHGNPEDGDIYGRPVYLTTIEKEENRYPLNDTDLMKLISSNRNKLQVKFGSPFCTKSYDYIDEFIKTNISDLLKAAVPKEFAGNIIAARQSKGHNTLKQLDKDLATVRNFIQTAEIGNQFSMVADDGGSLRGVITEIIPPKATTDYAKPERYKIKFVVPGDEKHRTTSLLNLMKTENKFEFRKFGISGNFEKPDLAIFQNLPAGRVTVERKILDGNTTSALMTAYEKNIGRECRVTVEGNPHICVLVPKSKEKDLEYLAITAPDIPSAYALLQQEYNLYTDPKKHYEGLRIDHEYNRLVVKIPHKKSLKKPFMDSRITDITGSFQKAQYYEYAYINNVSSDLPKLLSALTQLGCQFHFDSEARNSLDDFMRNNQTNTPEVSNLNI